MPRSSYSLQETARIKSGIVGAALTLFGAHGVEKLSLRRLADHTSMSHTII